MLIVLEGIDGTGKATQTVELIKRLTGLRVGTLSSPDYAAHFGQVIGEYLNGKFGSLAQVHPKLAAVLYLNNMAENELRLRASLKQNQVTVLDRYVTSTLAYQGARMGMIDGPKASQDLKDWIAHTAYVYHGLPQPDLAIQFTAPVRITQQLVAKKRGRVYTDRAADLHEADATYLYAVSRQYDILAMTGQGAKKWLQVPIVDEDNGELRSIEVVADKVWSLVQEFARDQGIPLFDNPKE